MLAINNLTFHFGGRTIYEDANLHIKPKDRIGLIGPNGAGKSTLLRLIVGEYIPDSGSISYANDCSIGFLNQDLLSYQTDQSILSVALEAFEEEVQIQRRMDEILKKMEQDYSEELLEELAKLQERFEILDAYSMQAKAEEILEGLGFPTKDLSRPLKEFSGGWRMRVMLAKLLLQKPSLLMLDEPTNHLDLPSIQWIENYIQNYEGAIIAVSHDRNFINNVSNTIVEVSACQLHHYSGNYEYYIEEKAQRQEIQQAAYENQQQKIKQTERFIERFRAKATKAKQVQSRVKELERMNMIDEVIDDNVAINFRFNFSQASGKQVMHLDDVGKSYGDLTLFKETQARIMRGDKIALIGANGKGKSTLLRIIAGTEPVSGNRDMGYNVIFSFYAQHQLESLGVENPILEELKQAGSQKTETELRNLLGCFLFTNEDVFKRVKVLSGGEKSRVALAKVLISEANFLLLDEPTNHLDMQSVNILIQALQQYQGSYVIVSHDRYFISRVANKIWYIEDQQIKEYPGTYEEYEYWRSKNDTTSQETKKSKPSKDKTSANKNQGLSDEGKALKQKLNRLRKALEEIEETVFTLETEKEKIEEKLADPKMYEKKEEMFALQEEYKALEKKLSAKQGKWEDTALEIESIEEQLKNS